MAITKTLAEYVGQTPLLIYDILKILNPLAQAYELYVGSVPWLLYDLLIAIDGAFGGGGAVGSFLRPLVIDSDGTANYVVPTLNGRTTSQFFVFLYGTMRDAWSLAPNKDFTWTDATDTIAFTDAVPVGYKIIIFYV